MTPITKQKLFDYLSKELNATALETDLMAIERIVLDDNENKIEKSYSKLGELTFDLIKTVFKA